MEAKKKKGGFILIKCNIFKNMVPVNFVFSKSGWIGEKKAILFTLSCKYKMFSLSPLICISFKQSN